MAVISAMDSLNPIAARIVDLVKGTVLISDLFGRRLGGVNHEVRIRALSGMGKNPNVGAVLVVSLHRTSALTVAEPLAASGVDVEIVAFQELGSSLKAIEQGARIAVKMVKNVRLKVDSGSQFQALTLGWNVEVPIFRAEFSATPRSVTRRTA